MWGLLNLCGDLVFECMCFHVQVDDLSTMVNVPLVDFKLSVCVTYQEKKMTKCGIELPA